MFLTQAHICTLVLLRVITRSHKTIKLLRQGIKTITLCLMTIQLLSALSASVKLSVTTSDKFYIRNLHAHIHVYIYMHNDM